MGDRRQTNYCCRSASDDVARSVDRTSYSEVLVASCRCKICLVAHQDQLPKLHLPQLLHDEGSHVPLCSRCVHTLLCLRPFTRIVRSVFLLVALAAAAPPVKQPLGGDEVQLPPPRWVLYGNTQPMQHFMRFPLLL